MWLTTKEPQSYEGTSAALGLQNRIMRNAIPWLVSASPRGIAGVRP